VKLDSLRAASLGGIVMIILQIVAVEVSPHLPADDQKSEKTLLAAAFLSVVPK
jgi:hypothetical protein